MQHLKVRLLLTEGGDTGDASFLLQVDNMAEIKPLITNRDANWSRMTIDKQSLPPATEVAERLWFHSCLSVCSWGSGRGGSQCNHYPWSVPSTKTMAFSCVLLTHVYNSQYKVVLLSNLFTFFSNIITTKFQFAASLLAKRGLRSWQQKNKFCFFFLKLNNVELQAQRIRLYVQLHFNVKIKRNTIYYCTCILLVIFMKMIDLTKKKLTNNYKTKFVNCFLVS